MRSSKAGWAMPFALVLFASFSCDRKPPAPTAEGKSQPDASAVANAAPPAETAAPVEPPPAPTNPIREIDAGPPDWYKCQASKECVVVTSGRCCPDCDPLPFVGYTAVNSKRKGDWMAYQGCADAKCPCPERVKHVPYADANFFALCQQHRCVAIDLRYSKYSECKTSSDCTLRRGIGCCEACGDADLITYNPKSTLLADTCPVKQKCPPTPEECQRERHPAASAECALGHCQLADY